MRERNRVGNAGRFASNSEQEESGGKRQVSCPGNEGLESGQRQTGSIPGEADYQRQKQAGHRSRKPRAGAGGAMIGGQGRTPLESVARTMTKNQTNNLAEFDCESGA